MPHIHAPLESGVDNEFFRLRHGVTIHRFSLLVATMHAETTMLEEKGAPIRCLSLSAVRFARCLHGLLSSLYS